MSAGRAKIRLRGKHAHKARQNGIMLGKQPIWRSWERRSCLKAIHAHSGPDMPEPKEFILGEFQRTFDERYRLAIPAELVAALGGDQPECVLAKERPGCLSLWNAETWQGKLTAGIDLVQAKIRAGRLDGKLGQVQMLGRLLSSRHRTVPMAARGRVLIPEGFREFLQAEPGGEVIVVGAAVCVEIWNPKAWLAYLERRMPKFRRLFDQLSG